MRCTASSPAWAGRDRGDRSALAPAFRSRRRPAPGVGHAPGAAPGRWKVNVVIEASGRRADRRWPPVAGRARQGPGAFRRRRRHRPGPWRTAHFAAISPTRTRQGPNGRAWAATPTGIFYLIGAHNGKTDKSERPKAC